MNFPQKNFFRGLNSLINRIDCIDLLRKRMQKIKKLLKAPKTIFFALFRLLVKKLLEKTGISAMRIKSSEGTIIAVKANLECI